MQHLNFRCWNIFTCFIGNVAPFHITQPSTDNYMQTVSSTEELLTLTCLLNINIPSTVTVTWLHNDSTLSGPTGVNRTTNNATLNIGSFEPSDAGVYQCVFNDTATGYVSRRNITLLSMCSTKFCIIT